ncbi:hypothetical protein DSUL_30058 [Desulfovibrionales bacterium]
MVYLTRSLILKIWLPVGHTCGPHSHSSLQFGSSNIINYFKATIKWTVLLILRPTPEQQPDILIQNIDNLQRTNS